MRSRLFSQGKKLAEILPSVVLGSVSSVATGYCLAEHKKEGKVKLTYNPAGVWMPEADRKSSASMKPNP